MKFIYVRLRTIASREGFLEFYLCYKDGALRLPEEKVERFEGRTHWRTDLDFDNQMIVVNSIPGAVTKRTDASIRSEGAWCTDGDLRPLGGVPCYFGVHIRGTGASLDVRPLYKALGLNIRSEPWVVYHGTAKTNVKSILEHGLMPSYGMLGHAVYTGSFWKAFRFATLSQTYEPRPGSIMRCYAFWKTNVLRPTYMRDPCKCSECILKHKPDSNCDHLAVWKKYGDSVMAYPMDGSSLKNEEFACPDGSSLSIDSVAYATAQTQHHEPTNRALVID